MATNITDLLKNETFCRYSLDTTQFVHSKRKADNIPKLLCTAAGKFPIFTSVLTLQNMNKSHFKVTHLMASDFCLLLLSVSSARLLTSSTRFREASSSSSCDNCPAAAFSASQSFSKSWSRFPSFLHSLYDLTLGRDKKSRIKTYFLTKKNAWCNLPCKCWLNRWHSMYF